MKQELSNLINEEIKTQLQAVNDAFPSIYTKDDVANLLNTMAYNLTVKIVQLEVPESNPLVEEIQIAAINDFAKILEDRLDDISFQDEDLLDFSNAEFSIDYGNKIVLDSVGDIDNDAIVDRVIKIVRKSKSEYYEEAGINATDTKN